MASRIGSVLQDQNLNLHDATSGWKTNPVKAPKKGGFGGRTPLGDLSNSVKPSLNQTSKKPKFDVTKMTTSSKAPTKVGRKALSDISNSGVRNANESSKKIQIAKHNAKAEDQINLSSIAEEGFLHNHQECINAQRSMDLDQFLQILGLDIDASKQLKDQQLHAMSVKEEDESLMKYEVEEMIEPVIVVSSGRLDSPPACSPPASPSTSTHWNNEDDYEVDFKLKESPKK